MKQKITEEQIRRVIRTSLNEMFSPALDVVEQADTIKTSIENFQKFLEGDAIRQFRFVKGSSDFEACLREVERYASKLLTAIEDLNNVRP